MNDAVKKYKVRRKKRLDARGYRVDEDQEWITMNGTHIPIEDGKAVGGPVNGKAFEDAKSSKTGSAPRPPKRKQKEVPEGFMDDYGKVRGKYVEEFNRRAEKAIMEETGYSEAETKKFHNALLDYLGNDYPAYATGGKKENIDIIDEGLSRMGAFDGEIYRGMYFKSGDENNFRELEAVEVGDELKMRTISSWSSSKWVADDFADDGGMEKNSVVITCKKNKSGVGVKHISRFANSEDEVLSPSTARWKVTAKKSMSKYDYLKEQRKNVPSFLKMVEEPYYKEKYQSARIIWFEVEEI